MTVSTCQVYVERYVLKCVINHIRTEFTFIIQPLKMVERNAIRICGASSRNGDLHSLIAVPMLTRIWEREAKDSHRGWDGLIMISVQ